MGDNSTREEKGENLSSPEWEIEKLLETDGKGNKRLKLTKKKELKNG